jgi:23S rRNA (cytosine1962-C5)-methyltransferase
MLTANGWTEYEVLDAGGGEKLERWGKYTLIRPDPQVIWERDGNLPGWKRPNAHYHRSSKGGGEWEFFDLPDEWELSYVPLDLHFHLKPFKFKHTGLFPEQAVNWDWMRELIAKRRSEGKNVSVINLFGYTGGATVACAAEGASVCHVDAAKGMVERCKENIALSNLQGSHVRYIVDDCFKFVTREIKRGNKYDGIILDPPSYGRGPGGEVWKLEDNLFKFVKQLTEIMSEEPLFLLLNSYTTGFSPCVTANILEMTVNSKFNGKVFADDIGLPIRSGKKIVLPCGSSARWES